jgi:hypothetical protein
MVTNEGEGSCVVNVGLRCHSDVANFGSNIVTPSEPYLVHRTYYDCNTGRSLEVKEDGYISVKVKI